MLDFNGVTQAGFKRKIPKEGMPLRDDPADFGDLYVT